MKTFFWGYVVRVNLPFIVEKNLKNTINYRNYKRNLYRPLFFFEDIFLKEGKIFYYLLLIYPILHV